MRRSSKASTAGSDLPTGACLGSFRRLGALALGLFMAACLIPGSAFAVETRPQVGSFGSGGTSASSFEFPSALAFDQGNGHLYVLDRGPSEIDGFDASTPATLTPLGGGFPLAVEADSEVPDLAVDSASHDFYYAISTGSEALYGFDSTGAALGGSFPLTGIGFPCGAAVDPAGNIWVASFNSQAVYEFDSSGSPIGSVSVAGQGYPCHIAFDSESNLYAALYEGEVWRYSAASGYLDATEIDPAPGTPTNAIAVDRSSDDLYVAHPGYVSAYDSAGALLYEFGAEVSAAHFSGVAVNEATDQVYVSDRGNEAVQVFGPAAPLPGVLTEDADGVTTTQATLHGTVDTTGTPAAECEFQYVTNEEMQALSVSADAGTFTLSFEGESAQAMEFDEPASSVQELLDNLPTIGGVGGSVKVRGGPGDAGGTTPYTITFGGALAHKDVEAIATDASHLSGGAASAEVTTINQGKPLGFEEATSAPCEPAGPISGSQALSAELSGLLPGATYHFRLVAHTPEGTANGAARTLATAIGPPAINDQTVEEVGASDAILRAKLNPMGAASTYRVEYGTTAAYGQSTAASAPIGFAGDDGEHIVSVHVGGLAPGTAYHFRFLATNVAGSAGGTDATFATHPEPVSYLPCPNDQLRSGFGARLPDCRAYEQATPIDKHGANIQGTTNAIQASSAGDRVTFYLVGGLRTSGGSSNLSPFMASRGAAGWSSDGLLPSTSPGLSASVVGWSEDLSSTVATAPGPGNVGEAIYLRDSATAAFGLGAESPTRFQLSLAGFAANPAHLLIESEASFTPGAAPFKTNLYDLDHGNLTLVGRIPSGSARSCDDEGGPACVPAPEGSFAGPYDWRFSTAEGGASRNMYTQNAISRDGSRVFFTTANSAQLYVREDGAKTTRISASQATVPDPNGEKPAAFMAATPDGSKVFFTSCEKLTDDSTAVSTAANTCIGEAQGQDLYSYDADSGVLSDLTVDSNAGDLKGAAVHGVLGASEDGSYVYFVAAGVLAPGASPAASCEAFCNLYVSHDGATTFIASLVSRSSGPSDSNDWQPGLGFSQREPKISRVSADGRTLLFSSIQSLTGYENSTPTGTGCQSFGGVESEELCAELYRYSAPGEEMSCVSCNPTGVPPRGEAALGTTRPFNSNSLRSTFLTRNLSADGNRVFFDSRDALLPTDTNGVNDVYEWEAKGSGSCESESHGGGCLYLLSSGTSPDPSYFGDASANGDHAFIFTSQQLVPTDHDELIDVYDAGVGAGLASQHVLAPPTCTGVACQANPAPPPDQPMSSATFSGPGNATKPSSARKCPKGKRKVRRAGKVHCQKAHKQHKRHPNRGGSK